MPMDRQEVAAVYRAYLAREGPNNLGTVVWPEAKEGCLRGLKFLTTGVLETITREDAIDLIRNCSGHVMSGMSKNLNYLVVGRDAGPVKLEKAAEWEITQLSEEEFFTFMSDKIENYVPGEEDEEVNSKKKATKKAPKKAVAKKEKEESAESSDVKEESVKSSEVKEEVVKEAVSKKKPTMKAAKKVDPKEEVDEEIADQNGGDEVKQEPEQVSEDELMTIAEGSGKKTKATKKVSKKVVPKKETKEKKKAVPKKDVKEKKKAQKVTKKVKQEVEEIDSVELKDEEEEPIQSEDVDTTKKVSKKAAKKAPPKRKSKEVVEEKNGDANVEDEPVEDPEMKIDEVEPEVVPKKAKGTMAARGGCKIHKKAAPKKKSKEVAEEKNGDAMEDVVVEPVEDSDTKVDEAELEVAPKKARGNAKHKLQNGDGDTVAKKARGRGKKTPVALNGDSENPETVEAIVAPSKKGKKKVLEPVKEEPEEEQAEAAIILTPVKQEPKKGKSKTKKVAAEPKKGSEDVKPRRGRSART